MDESVQPTAVGRTACGVKLKDTRGYPTALYGDERIYFCHHACLRVFEQSPDAFVAGQIEHPKKES